MEHHERGGRCWGNGKDTAPQLEQGALQLQADGRLQEAESRAADALKNCDGALERCRVLCTQASIRLDRGHYDQATADAHRAYENLVDYRPGAGRDTDQLRVRAMCLLATGLFQTERFADARSLLDRALGYCQHWLGADGEACCRVLTLLGTLEKQAGARHLAEEHYRRALQIAERVCDPFSGEVAAACHQLALLAEGWEEGNSMRPFAERACEIRCGMFGSTHPLTAAAQTGLALTMEAAGDEGSAGEKFLYAIAIFDRHYAGVQCSRSILPESLRDYAICRAGAARYLVACGRMADAREFSSRAIPVFRNMLGKSHPLTVSVERDHRALLRSTQSARGSARPGSAWNWWRGFSFSR